MNRQTQIARRRDIEYGLIRKATKPVPKYGSEEFLALEPGSPEFVASIVVAAGAWAADGDNVEVNLRHEVEHTARAAKTLEDEQYVADVRGHRRQWGHLRLVPARDDLETRVAKARAPRPGDFRPDRGGDLDAG